MKYFTNLFVFLAWYLDKISDINATNITQEERIKKLRLSEMWKSSKTRTPNLMIIIERNVLLLDQTMMHNIKYSENELKMSEIGETHMYHPTSIAKAPDGAFDVPSVTVTSFGRISQIDVSDPQKPRIASDLRNGSRNDRYISHVWINKNEFYVTDYDGLLHFGNKNEGETKEWNSKKVSSGKLYDMLLFQYGPKSFVLYARETPQNMAFTQLVIMWPEDAEGKPGDWRNEEHIRKEYIKYDTYSLTSADVNNDGKTDLLLSTEFKKEIEIGSESTTWYIEIRAFEIPHLEEIKNPDKYKEHVLISSDSESYTACYVQMKTFIPFVSYKGKPWIYIGLNKCSYSWYLQPQSDEAGDWSYKKTLFHVTTFRHAQIIEVADFNQDGYAELIQLGDDIDVYSFSNGKIIVTDPPSTPSVELNVSSVPSSSSILYLDSTLPMFIGLAFALRLL